MPGLIRTDGPWLAAVPRVIHSLSGGPFPSSSPSLSHATCSLSPDPHPSPLLLAVATSNNRRRSNDETTTTTTTTTMNDNEATTTNVEGQRNNDDNDDNDDDDERNECNLSFLPPTTKVFYNQESRNSY